MMKITVPTIVEPLDLGGFHPDFAGQALQVWVNPPGGPMPYFASVRAMLSFTASAKALAPEDGTKAPTEKQQAELDVISKGMEELVRQMDDFLTRVWSAGPDPLTHISAADLREQTASQAPGLFNWCAAATLEKLLAWQKKR